MKQKNPLRWDLRSLPDKSFDQRALSIYKRDANRGGIKKRGDIKGFVGTYSKQGQKSTWLPSLNIYVLPSEILDKISKDKIKNYVGANSNDFIWIGDIQGIANSHHHVFTPFMMVHDIGEVLFDASYELLPEPLEDLMYDIQSVALMEIESKNAFDTEFVAYLPRLVHVQPRTARKGKVFGYETTSYETVMNYMLGDWGNLLSDLFALWAKKERLVPNNFWRVNDLLTFLEEKKGYSPIHLVKRPLPIQQYCDLLNSFFTQVLDRLRGHILVNDVLIKL